MQNITKIEQARPGTLSYRLLGCALNAAVFERVKGTEARGPGRQRPKKIEKCRGVWARPLPGIAEKSAGNEAARKGSKPSGGRGERAELNSPRRKGGGTAPLLIYGDQRRCHAGLISPVRRDGRHGHPEVSNGRMYSWESLGENPITAWTPLANRS